MSKAKCSRTDYKYATDDQLDLKANAVKNGLAAHAASFPGPTVTPVALGTLIDTYQDTRTAYKRGGLDQKPAFTAAKNALLDALDEDADYVDEIADGSEELIVNAGYVPTKTSSEPVPAPAQPQAVAAKRGVAKGEVWVECPSVSGAAYYGLIVTEAYPLEKFSFENGLLALMDIGKPMAMELNKARKKHLQSLQPGVIYYFYMYAGNAAGVSPLSEVVQLMAA